MEKNKPVLRKPVTIEYEDGGNETIIVRRLSNTNLVKWLDSGFDKTFLIFRAIERAVPGDRVDQAWFDTLTQTSALTVVEEALGLNHSPDLQKKMLGPALAALQSFISMTPLNSSPAGDTKSPT